MANFASVNAQGVGPHWIGLSTDTKPTTMATIGQRAYETDTGAVYIWNGSAWSIMPGQLFVARKRLTFDGTAGLGAVGQATVFDVTGHVHVESLHAVGATNLVSAGGGTISLGTANRIGLFVAATTATDLLANEIWSDATPTEVEAIQTVAAMKDLLVLADITVDVLVAAVTAGAIDFYAVWRPLSATGKLVAA